MWDLHLHRCVFHTERRALLLVHVPVRGRAQVGEDTLWFDDRFELGWSSQHLQITAFPHSTLPPGGVPWTGCLPCQDLPSGPPLILRVPWLLFPTHKSCPHPNPALILQAQPQARPSTFHLRRGVQFHSAIASVRNWISVSSPGIMRTICS